MFSRLLKQLGSVTGKWVEESEAAAKAIALANWRRRSPRRVAFKLDANTSEDLRGAIVEIN